MKAVVYARISKEEQSVYSLDQQLKECRAYIESEGHELVDTYVDDGWSAKDMHRPELQRMLQEITSKKFQLIVIWKLDRLTRSTLDGLTLVETFFRPNGIQFASKTEDIDTTTSDGYMMFTIRLSMAQAEREKIRDRSTMGHIARAKSGKRISHLAPYGYKIVDDLHLEVVEEEAEIVKQIYTWYLSGYGKLKIGKLLNERNVPCPKGGKFWRESNVHTIITNPTYYGANHFKRRKLPDSERIIVENAHPPIIPKEIWMKAQDYQQRRRDNTMNMSSYDFPFSTIVKCGLCGRSYHGKLKSRGQLLNDRYERTRSYRCSGRYRPDNCDASDIEEKKLTELIFREIEFEAAEYDPNIPVTKEQPNQAKEVKRLTKELEKSKTRLVNLAKAMASGDLDFDIYTKLREEEKTKIAGYEEQLAGMTEAAVSEEEAKRLGYYMREILDIKSLWHTWDFFERKSRIQKLFKEIVILKVNGKWEIQEYTLHG